MRILGPSTVLVALLPIVSAPPQGKPSAAGLAVPAISLCQAIERVEIWAAQHGVDISSQFVREARLTSDPGAPGEPPCWEVIYQWATPRLGGELRALVRMDGTITARPLGP